MEVLNLYGLLGALVIGVVLGLTGGGGSILTVPILVYILSVNPVTATAYSLFVVGTTALFGTIRNAQKGMIEYRTAFVFSVPAFIAVYLTRKLIIPAIPDTIFTFNEFVFTKNLAVMLFFAFIMLLASVSMIRTRKEVVVKETRIFNYPLIIIEGFVVGVLTGLVGAGGGFLIIPALVLLAGLDMKIAIGTSLVIIAMKSIIGFGGDLYQGFEVDWIFVFYVLMATTIGVLMGNYISKFFSGPQLKKF